MEHYYRGSSATQNKSAADNCNNYIPRFLKIKA